MLTRREREFIAGLERVFELELLPQCHLCRAERLPQFFSQAEDGSFWCRDLWACDREARRRLGVSSWWLELGADSERHPGRIGGREGRRRLAEALAACEAYRKRRAT